MNTLLAFHGDPKIKEKYLARVSQHEKADEIIKGRYWEDGKGCAVGCTIEGSNHNRYETELGIPAILAYLEDALFEEMSNAEAKTFPRRFLEAIPVGANLLLVFAKLTVWEWEDPTYGLKTIKEIADDKELVDCCEKVITLYKRAIEGKTVEPSEWIALEGLADTLYSARAEARAEAMAEAGVGAWAEVWVRARAWAGDEAWAWAGARAWAWAWADYNSDYRKQVSITADKLIELLAASK